MTHALHPGISRRDLLQRGALVFCSAALPSAGLRAQVISPVMAALSSYMAGAKDRSLPPEVVEKAKHHILDTFAAIFDADDVQGVVVRLAPTWAPSSTTATSPTSVSSTWLRSC